MPHYKDFKVIGNGAFGNFIGDLILTNIGYVFKAFDTVNGLPVAIKRSQKVGNKVSREYEVLQALKGKPNVI
jgi:hypothetical protein